MSQKINEACKIYIKIEILEKYMIFKKYVRVRIRVHSDI